MIIIIAIVLFEVSQHLFLWKLNGNKKFGATAHCFSFTSKYEATQDIKPACLN